MTGISSFNIFNHATTTTLKKKWGAAATCFFDNSFRSAAGGRAGTSLAFGCFLRHSQGNDVGFCFLFYFFSLKRGRRKSGRVSCASTSFGGKVKELKLYIFFFVFLRSAGGARAGASLVPLFVACTSSSSLFVEILGHRVLKNSVQKPRPST